MATQAEVRGVLNKLGPWIDKYNVGIPRGVMAAFINHESGGNFAAAGDSSLGEIGFLQIAAYVPPLFGLPASARMDPETNVALGAAEYGLEASLFKLRYPQLVELGTPDSWMLGRLSFAVGRGGSYQLADRAIAGGYASRGNLFGGIQKWTNATGGMSLGTQSASKVASRVNSIPAQWALGMSVDPSGLGPPTFLPDPPAGKLTIPANVQALFSQPISGIVALGLGLGATVLWFLWRRFRRPAG